VATWRLDASRTHEYPSINTDAFKWMQSAFGDEAALVGALVGPRGDCYSPEEAPDVEEAQVFHAPQLAELKAAGDIGCAASAGLPSRSRRLRRRLT